MSLGAAKDDATHYDTRRRRRSRRDGPSIGASEDEESNSASHKRPPAVASSLVVSCLRAAVIHDMCRIRTCLASAQLLVPPRRLARVAEQASHK